jgi:acetyl esterase
MTTSLQPRRMLTWLALAAAATCAAQAQAADPPSKASATMAKTGTAFKADADMQAVLDELASLGGKPIETLTPDEARKQPTPTDAVMSLLKKRGKDTTPTALVPGVSSVDREIPGAAGNIPARIYTPQGAGPFPVVVYFHGGGWVIADKQVYDGGARGLSKEAQAIVVSVDYRRAPEAKFPAAWDDALAAYKWVAANAASINGDPRQLALAGESAGGNLAVATAVAARDAGVQQPMHVLAVYPVAQTGNMETASYKDSAMAKPLNKAMIGWFVDKLLAKPDDKADPRLDLVNAKLNGLPPVTIINAQIDPLREDGTLLEAALKRAGVKVQRKVYAGTAHEFFGMGAAVKKAAEAQKYGGQALRDGFKTMVAKR